MTKWALMFEALFILTTVDTGTRVARFILQEWGSYAYKPLGKTQWIPGTILSSFLVVGSWAYLFYSGSISTIWPMFGVANQLLAAIAFCVGATIIIKMNKLKYAWMTFVPMVFMFVTTFTASYELFLVFLEKAATSPTNEDAFTFRLDAVLVAFMAILAAIALVDSAHKWYGYLSGKKEMVTTEVIEQA